MRSVITIKDRAAAAVFASLQQGKIVQTLIGEEMTMAALARAVATPLNLLHYHVSKCVDLGLVEVVREEPRAGRAVKHYRATAKAFFVPSELLVELPGAEMTRDLRAALDRSVTKSLKGVTFSHDGKNPRIQLVRDPAAKSNAVELWLDIGLTAADAAELKQDLETVLTRYRARGDDREPRYLVHLAAVKV